MSEVRPTFSDERRLREVSGLPVFGTVVMASTEAQLAKRKRGLIALVLSFLSLLSAYAAIMAMLLPVVVFFFAQRAFMRGVVFGGVEK